MVCVTWRRIYFRRFPGIIRSLQVVKFVSYRLNYIFGAVFVIWDGLRAHRSQLMQEFAEEQEWRLPREFLPIFVPEFNSVEPLWGH
jgi:transposase